MHNELQTVRLRDCTEMRTWRRFRLLMLLLALLPAAPLHAIGPQLPMAQMEHTAWTGRDGLSGFVKSIAQTRDGYLWVGTSAGLYRFDGIKFIRWAGGGDKLPADDISVLRAAPDGGLWVGFSFGGLALIKDGRAVTYSLSKGVPGAYAQWLDCTPDGRVWAGFISWTNSGLLYFEHGKWNEVLASSGYPGHIPQALFVDDAGTLWVVSDKASGGHVLTLSPGTLRFHDTGLQVNRTIAIFESPDGGIWSFDGDKDRLVRLRGPTPLTHRHPTQQSDSSSAALFDRDGSLWYARETPGLRRIANPSAFPPLENLTANDPKIEAFMQQQGLSSQLPWTILEDREGNIWVGTQSGVDRFRYRNVTWSALPKGFRARVLFRGEGNDVWAALFDQASGSYPTVRAQDQAPLKGVPNNLINGYRDTDGSYWLSQRGHFWHFADGRSTEVPLPGNGVDDVLLVRRDSTGCLWIVASDNGLYRQDSAGWVRVTPFPERPNRTALDLYAAPGGELLALYINAIAVIRHGEVERVIHIPDQQTINMRFLASAGGHLWVAGGGGLGMLVGDAIVPVLDEDGMPFGTVSSMTGSDRSGLWFVARSRIVHIATGDLLKVTKQDPVRVHADIYDQTNDLPDEVTALVEGADGIIWAISPIGIIKLDPSHIQRNLVPPSIVIEGVRADESALPSTGVVTVPPGRRDLRIDFAVLSLTIPERNRAKYQLVGWDRGWREAGERREALYSNLPPGSYEFRVVAANNDGVWNEAGSSVRLRIVPAFYQTWWFRTLCGLLFGVLLWSLFLYRMNRVVRLAQERLMVRTDERERIARELHDSLLQSFQGLLLHLQFAANVFPAGTPESATLEGACDRSGQVIAEARDKVMELRREAISTSDLTGSLTEQWHELARFQQCSLNVIASGTVHPLKPQMEDEIRLIASEAISNALRYARASAVTVSIGYDVRAFTLSVEDDGIGIDNAILQHGSVKGHWGLIGMRERAEKLGGKLELHSEAAQGTAVTVSFPSRIVYVRPTLMNRLEATFPRFSLLRKRRANRKSL